MRYKRRAQTDWKEHQLHFEAPLLAHLRHCALSLLVLEKRRVRGKKLNLEESAFHVMYAGRALPVDYM